MKNIADLYTLSSHLLSGASHAPDTTLPIPPSRPIPGALGPSRSGPLDNLTSRGRAAQAEAPQAGPPLVEHPGSAQRPRGPRNKLMVSLDSEFSEKHDAALTAHRITIQAVQAKFAKTDAVRQLPADHPLARFSADKLDHVLVDKPTFSKLARAAGTAIEGDPQRFPVFFDTGRKAIVVDTSRAFSGDDFTAAALQGIGRAFRTHDLGIADDAWRPVTGPTSRKLDAGGRKRTSGGTASKSTPANGTPAHPWPVRHRNALHLEYPYPGREVSSTSRGADFYKADAHHGIEDL